MHIFITNDDGYTSKGLQALIQMARPFGEITVVAPQYPQSAMSSAVSIGKMLRMVPVSSPDGSFEEGIKRYYCSGTPVDCVKMALNVLFPAKNLTCCFPGSTTDSTVLLPYCIQERLAPPRKGLLTEFPLWLSA
jgi:5'-nucleotidase